MNTNQLSSLQKWFIAQCDGEWEHQFGIKIETLDNPGWAVKIELTGTKLENRSFERINVERNPTDWLRCSIENNVFLGFGGPLNLDEIVSKFYEFVSNINAG